MTSFFRRLLGSGLPDGFAGTLEHDEHVLAVAAPLVATSRGLWVPDGDGVRRIGWHLISKATWAAGALSVTESVESDTAGSAVVLEDKQTERYGLSAPGKLPSNARSPARTASSSRSAPTAAPTWPPSAAWPPRCPLGCPTGTSNPSANSRPLRIGGGAWLRSAL
jgi:hypothetical protein